MSRGGQHHTPVEDERRRGDKAGAHTTNSYDPFRQRRWNSTRHPAAHIFFDPFDRQHQRARQENRPYTAYDGN